MSMRTFWVLLIGFTVSGALLAVAIDIVVLLAFGLVH